jgi:hypothetical protein
MANSNQVGLFVSMTNVWDIPELQKIDPSIRELFVRLYQNTNNQAQALNLSEKGMYPLQEFVTGSVYFPNPANNSTTAAVADLRQVCRKVINFGALPNAGTKSVAHGIAPTTSFTFTRIYATASDTTGKNYIPIPYASPVLASNIELNVDATNVNIITGSNRTNFNICYVVLEYIKF